MSTPTTVRAKFTCGSKVPMPSQTTVSFYAVYSNKDGTRAEENKAFSDATPAGTVQITIANDKPALEAFEVGKAYYLDFTAAD